MEKNVYVSFAQKEGLVDYLEQHKQLVRGKFDVGFTQKVAKNMWEEMAKIVNAIPGAQKDWTKWTKFKCKVILCEKSQQKKNNDSQNCIDGYNLILNDTILFPEGGGQPCDHGTINGKPVLNVTRIGSEAIHFVKTNKPFERDEEVIQKLDWSRRLDHMQQHSGQHLITALFEREFTYNTKSWWLGNEVSYIELEAKDVTQAQLDHVQNLANELILSAKRVSVSVVDNIIKSDFPDMRAPRGLPEDHVGPVRVITIEDIESNMCCGTHVTNLSQLQAIKLLNAEKSKNKLTVNFLVGKRVVNKLNDCYQRELQMNTILKGGPDVHVDLILKMQTNFKSTNKNFQKLLKEIAIVEAKNVHALNPRPKYYFLHRQDGIEPDFINIFLRNSPTEIFYFLSVGDIKGKGHVVLKGDENVILALGETISILLDGKGNRNGKMFQAKVNNLNKIKECETKIKEYFLNFSAECIT